MKLSRPSSRGQNLVEYGLAIVIVAVASINALQHVATAMNDSLHGMSADLNAGSEATAAACKVANCGDGGGNGNVGDENGVGHTQGGT